jgi:hypothetical protein
MRGACIGPIIDPLVTLEGSKIAVELDEHDASVEEMR